MERSVFSSGEKILSLSDYVGPQEGGRENLGAELPVAIYRLLEYSIREELDERFGKEAQIEVFRDAGYRAGIFFAKNYLDLTLDFHGYISQMQKKLEEFKIGVLRVETLEDDTGKMVVTISEDADCSGLPMLGETVCNYDEGFLSGLLTAYTKKQYSAVEINCWATGDRVCRFKVEAQSDGGR